MESVCAAEWTNQNVRKLLEAMKSNIPNTDSKKIWSAGLKSFDWSKVAFEPFSAEECCAKWQGMLKKLRKIKTLTELIVDAQTCFSNPSSRKKLKYEQPKKPASANALYFAANVTKFKRKNPTMNSRELMKYANDKYHKLSPGHKAKYLRRSLSAKEEYNTNMNGIRILLANKRLKRNTGGGESVSQNNSSSEDDTDMTLVPPPKPPMTGYNLFCREQKFHMTGIPQAEMTTVWSQRWNSLSNVEKAEYSRRCWEMKDKFNKELSDFLSGLNETEQEIILKKHHLKRPYPTTRKRKPSMKRKAFPGEPKMPTRSISALHCKRQMRELKGTVTSARDRFAKASFDSKSLSNNEKALYMAEINKNLETYAVHLQRWFETLTSTQQQEYCEQNPSKVNYLQQKCGSRISHHRASDSEDEDFEDSNSESDDVICVEKDDEQEEIIMYSLF